MNLNKEHKQAIVSAVIADIPRKRIDPSGDLQKLVDADIDRYAPPEVAVLWKNKELAVYLDIDHNNIHYLVPDARGETRWGGVLYHIGAQHPRLYKVSADGNSKIQALHDELLDEYRQIEAARVALANTVAGLRTRKAFVTMFPELEKYAPEEAAVSTNLPAIANVMAGLTKLGWPDKSKKAAA